MQSSNYVPKQPLAVDSQLNDAASSEWDRFMYGEFSGELSV